MKNIVYILSAMVILLSSSCMDNKQGKNYNNAAAIDDGGITFIKNGLEAGLTEIKVAKLAEINSKNPRVINFAKMMIANHSEADDDLQKIAIKNRVTGSDSVSSAHQQMIMELTNKLGVIFDAAYMKMMVSDHEDAVTLFTAGSQNGNAVIQNFAKKELPVLQMHLDSAKAISASLK